MTILSKEKDKNLFVHLFHHPRVPTKQLVMKSVIQLSDWTQYRIKFAQGFPDYEVLCESDYRYEWLGWSKGGNQGCYLATWDFKKRVTILNVVNGAVRVHKKWNLLEASISTFLDGGKLALEGIQWDCRNSNTLVLVARRAPAEIKKGPKTSDLSAQSSKDRTENGSQAPTELNPSEVESQSLVKSDASQKSDESEVIAIAFLDVDRDDPGEQINKTLFHVTLHVNRPRKITTISSICISPETGNYIALVCCMDDLCQIVVISRDTKSLLKSLDYKKPFRVSQVEWTPDESAILVCRSDGSLDCIKFPEFQLMNKYPLPCFTTEATCLAWQPGTLAGQPVFAVGSNDGAIALWVYPGLYSVGTIMVDTARIRSLSFSPKGDILSVCSQSEPTQPNQFVDLVHVYSAATIRRMALKGNPIMAAWHPTENFVGCVVGDIGRGVHLAGKLNIRAEILCGYSTYRHTNLAQSWANTK